MRIRFLGLFLLAAALFATTPPAHADSNSVQFFTDLHVEPGKTVENAVCFFCSLEADGEVNGNIVIFFGNAKVNSTVHENVVSFFSNVTTRPNSSIDQNAVNIFGHLQLGDNAHVGQNVVAMFGATDVSPSAVIAGNRVLFPFWLFGIPALLIGWGIYAACNAVREHRYQAWLSQQPLPPQP